MSSTAFLALICAAGAFVVDFMALVDVYDVASLPTWLGISQAHEISSVAKVVALALVCRQAELQRVFLPLVVLAIVLATSLGFGFGADVLGLGGPARVAGLVLVWVLVAAGWLRASAALNEAPDESLHGYRQPLRVATLLIGLTMLAYFFDVPRIVSHWLFDLSLGGLGAASVSSAWALTARRRLALYTVALVVPGLVYLGPAFLMAGAILDENRERLATLGADRAPVEAAHGLPELLDDALDGYSLHARTPVFHDVWLFADGRALAIDRERLYERAPGEPGWRSVRKLPIEAEYLHFDERGTRGVLGASYDNPLITDDGGRSWTTFDAYALFSEMTGREFGDRMMDDASAIYLDPETGRGSFMMGCRFFTTSDFAATWEMHELAEGLGKNRCPADSPFAVDLDAGVAVASVMGSEFLLRRNDPGESWRAHCVIDFEAMLVVNDAPDCADEDVLSQRERELLDRREHEHELVTRQLYDSSELSSVDLESAALRSNGAESWLSGPGYLVLWSGSGSTIDTFVPRLETIIPFDAERAVGIAEGRLYETNDGGRVWRRANEGAERYLELLIVVADNGEAYFRSEDALWRADATELRAVGSLPDGFRLQHTASFRGELLLASDETILRSSDRGETWRRSPIPRPPDTVNDDGESWAAELSSLDCAVADDLRCVAVFDSGAALKWPLDAPENVAPLPNVPLEDGYASGPIVLMGDGLRPVYFPAETSRLLRLNEDGDAWDERRIGLVVDSAAHFAIDAERARLALQQAPGELLIVDATGASYLFDEDTWQEDAGDIEQARACWTGELTLFTNPDARLAVSGDGGRTWRDARAGSSLGTACGASASWLWLVAGGVSVYERDP